MPDFTVVVAILAGGVVGLLLMRWAGTQDKNERTRSDAPSASEPPTQTGYGPRPAPTSGPILLAVGLTLLGVGFAIGSGDAGLDARPLVPGALVLAAALAATLRRRNIDSAADRQAPSDGDAASIVPEDAALPSTSDSKHPPPH